MLALNLPVLAHTQTLSWSEAYRLNFTIETYLRDHDTSPPVRNPELLTIMLETDSTGQVSGIHLYADTQNVDSSYAILSRLTIQDFSKWKVPACSNRILIIPIYSAGVGQYSNEAKFADKVFRDVYRDIQRPTRVMHEKGRSVFMSPIIYLPQGKGISDPPAEGTSTPKQN